MMRVHVAEDGRTYDLPCSSDTVVDTVLASLQALTGISPENQLLICGDVRLEAGRTLGFYQLPHSPTGSPQATSPSRAPSQLKRRDSSHGSSESHVFLFNRSRLLARSGPPDVGPLPIVAVPAVPSELESTSHPFDKSSNPLLRTLPSYERQFRHDLLQSQAFLHASQQRFDICLRLVQEQHTQAMALRRACANMDVTGQQTCRSFEDFERSYAQQHSRHAHLLSCFQDDVELLSSCLLPGPLRSSTGRSSLLDFVKLPRLREAFMECQVAHSQMEQRVAEFRSQVEDIKEGLRAMLRGPELRAEMLEGVPVSAGSEGALNVEEFLRHLDRKMQEGHRSVEEQETAVAILSEDLGTVRKLLQDCLESFSPASSTSSAASSSSGTLPRQNSVQPLDAVAALDPICNVHTNQLLPRVAECDNKLNNLLGSSHAAKVAMTSAVHQHLQLVARLQSRVRDVRNQLHVFREAVAHQDNAFSEISAARGVRRSYAACLAEVVRRLAFGRAYTARAQELAEILGCMREEEIERRQEFARQQMLMPSQFGSSASVPTDVLSALGLTDLPPPCEVSIQSFDACLIQISSADIPRALKEEGGDSSLADISKSAEAIHAEYMESSAHKEGGDTTIGHQSGPDGLEALKLENTRLQAELAVALAGEGYGKLHGGEGKARWEEALRRKEAEVQQMAALAEDKQQQICAYEKRIQELEALLQQQQQQQHQQQQQQQQHAQAGIDEVQQQVAEYEKQVQEMQALLSQQQSKLAEWEASAATAKILKGESSERGMVFDPLGRDLRSMGSHSQGSREEESGQSLVEREGAIAPMVSGGSGSVVMGTPGEAEVASAKEVPAAGLIPRHDLTAPLDASSSEEPNQGAQEGHHADNGVTAEHFRQLGIGPRSGSNTAAGESGRTAVSVAPGVGAAEGGIGGRDCTAEEIEQLKRTVAQLKDSVVELEGALRQKGMEHGELSAQLHEAQLLLQHKEAVLAECQLNCAHLENKLHDAREEARTNRCAAERRAGDYAALRAAAVYTRSLLEGLARCLVDPTTGAPKPSKEQLEALRAFATSLAAPRDASQGQTREAESEEWVRGAVRVIVSSALHMMERAAQLDKTSEELQVRLQKATDALMEICDKHEIAKAALKDKIAFRRFQLQDLAVFFRTREGHYQALSSAGPDMLPHFLAPNSVALVHTGSEPNVQDNGRNGEGGEDGSTGTGPPFVVGRIVHIQRSTVPAGTDEMEAQDSAACTYGLPAGAAFALASIALLAQ